MTTEFATAPERRFRPSLEAATRPLRIAYVVSTFEAGGLERCVANLVNQLDQRSFEPMVISLTRSGSAAGWIERKDIPIHSIGKRPGNDLRAVGRLARVLRSEKVDVVHSHNWGTLLETVIARHRAGVPVHIHAEHGLELNALQAPRWKQRLRRHAMSWGFRRVDAVVACASSVRDRLSRQFPCISSSLQVIPNGIALYPSHGCSPLQKPDSQENRVAVQRLRRELGIPENALVLGSISRLAAVKDFPNAIRTLSILTERGRNVHLVLAGDGPERIQLEQLTIAERLTQRVHFVGRQTDIASWLQLFDIYVNSSLSEAMCLGILEAMASETCVVATNVGDTAELIGGDAPCGMVVPPGNSVALADAIEQLIDDEALRITLGENGVRRHAESYSVSQMASNYAKLYLEKSGLSQ